MTDDDANTAASKEKINRYKNFAKQAFMETTTEHEIVYDKARFKKL